MIEERWMEDGEEWMASILNSVQIRARCLLQLCSCVSISKIFLPIHKAPHSNQIMMIRQYVCDDSSNPFRLIDITTMICFFLKR
jgi:hypothetical protein